MLTHESCLFLRCFHLIFSDCSNRESLKAWEVDKGDHCSDIFPRLRWHSEWKSLLTMALMPSMLWLVPPFPSSSPLLATGNLQTSFHSSDLPLPPSKTQGCCVHCALCLGEGHFLEHPFLSGSSSFCSSLLRHHFLVQVLSGDLSKVGPPCYPWSRHCAWPQHLP